MTPGVEAKTSHQLAGTIRPYPQVKSLAALQQCLGVMQYCDICYMLSETAFKGSCLVCRAGLVAVLLSVGATLILSTSQLGQ